MITPERRAELEAELDELLGPEPLPKPKVVVSNGAVILDADVRVSPADRRNSRYGTVEVVSVRRPDWVTINMAAADRQYWDRVNSDAADRQHRRAIDPVGLGHWSNPNDWGSDDE